MPKRRSPMCLRNLSVLALGKLIQNTYKALATKKCESENSAILCIEDIFKNLPFQLVNDVFDQVLKNLADVFHSLNHDVNFNKIDDIIYLFCDSRVRNLSFENICDEFHGKIIDRLHCMTGVQYLDLAVTSCNFNTAIVVGVTQMTNLTEFHHWDCTDEVVTALAHNCKSLKSLDVFCSDRVSDTSMMDLHVCKALRYLNVHYTSVSSYGCAAVLRSVTGLRKLVYLEFSDVLEELQESTPMNVAVLEGHVSVSMLSLMKALFPSLQEFTVDLSEGELNHDVIPVFTKLKILKIQNGSFYNSTFSKILDTNGVYLTRLVLCGIEFLDVDAIRTIAKCSRALTDLEFKYCNNSEQPPPLMSNFLNIETFQNLNALKIKYSRINIEDVLALSPDITILELYHVPNVTEDLLINIINKYPLKYLKDLHIYISNETNLGVAFVHKMLQCLESLEYLECNADLNEDDLSDLRMYITNKDMSVHISTYSGQEA